jgi:hypothetical protein
MRINAKWIWTLVAALPAVIGAAGCSGTPEIGACPTDNGSEEQCIWEGGVKFTPDEVSQADGFIFVRGQMEWQPCGMTPGRQTRTYRIDPADGTTAQMDAPANAEPVAIPAEGPIEVVPAGSMRSILLERTSQTSVLKTVLPIGQVLDEMTEEVLAEIQVAAVCEG